jgi:AsmA protein
MKTVLKLMAGLLILVVVLIVAAIVIIPRMFDPNDYKDQLAARIKQQTGREFSLSGPIELSLFPWVGASIGGGVLGNAEGFGPEPFARIGSAQVRIKVMPLLSKTVEVDRILLEGLVLNLARNAMGVTNWDDLVKSRLPGPKPQSTSGPAPPAPQTEQAPPLPINAVTIGGLEVKDARITWDDQQTQRKYAIEDLDLTTGIIEQGRPIPLTLGVHVSSSQPALQGQVQLAGNLNHDSRRVRYSFPDLKIDVRMEGPALPPPGIEASLTADVALNGLTQSLEVKALTLQWPQVLTVEGELQGRDIAALPRFSGRLAAAPFDLKQLSQKLGLKLPPMADSAALTSAAAKLTLDYGPEQLTLEEFNLVLDESTLSGTLQVSQFNAPQIRFSADLDQIDLDRYLPPKSESGSESAPADQPSAGSGSTAPAPPAGQEVQLSPADPSTEPELPLELLRSLTLNGELRIGRLKVVRIPMEPLALTVSGAKGRLALDPLAASLFEGQLTTRAALDVSGPQARIEVSPAIQGLQAGPLLTALTGKERLSGVTAISAELKAQGLTPAAIKQSLNGQAAFTFADGAVKGINLAQLIRTAQAALSGQAVSGGAMPQTDFSELKGTLRIVNGLIENQDLSAKSPLLRIAGQGTADLVSETLDYRLKTTLVGSLEGQGGKELAELKGIPIPISVTGSFDDPQYSLDLRAVLTEQAKAKAGKKIEEKIDQTLKEKVDPQVGDALKNTLKNLFQK